MAEEHFSSLPAGYEFDGYRIDSVLGSGGFGITYRAVEVAIGREVAIKEFFPRGTAVRDPDSITIRPSSSADETEFTWGLDRFLDEARTLVRFDHPNIVRVYRFFSGNGTAYLVMPLLGGETLEARLARQERLWTRRRSARCCRPCWTGWRRFTGAGSCTGISSPPTS